jgi:hypothetical protein
VGQIENWDEVNRRGTAELGYGDDTTARQMLGAQASYSYQGVRFSYYLEYTHKDQNREREPDQQWNVWRSKAVVEAAW